MKKTIIKTAFLLATCGILYLGSFLVATNKYMVLYTSNTCDVARTVSYEWQRDFYYPAAFVELKLFGNPVHRPSIQIETPELVQYYDEQWPQCKKL